jgi:hypothetical protein
MLPAPRPLAPCTHAADVHAASRALTSPAEMSHTTYSPPHFHRPTHTRSDQVAPLLGAVDGVDAMHGLLRPHRGCHRHA